MADDTSLANNRGWQIGLAIEAGMDEAEAHRRVSANEMAAPGGIAAAGIGGGAAGVATGLGGAGLASGGGAVGIGALTAVAAPGVAVGGVGYAVARAVTGIGIARRDHLLRMLTRLFGLNGQADKVVRLFEIEGKGRLVDGRRPPDSATTRALLGVLQKSQSDALVGLFCTPAGKLVMTFDLADGRYAFAVLISARKFSGGGIDSREEEFNLSGVSSVDLLIRILEREGFLQYPDILHDDESDA